MLAYKNQMKQQCTLVYENHVNQSQNCQIKKKNFFKAVKISNMQDTYWSIVNFRFLGSCLNTGVMLANLKHVGNFAEYIASLT